MNKKIKKRNIRKQIQRMQQKAKEAMQFADLIKVEVLQDEELSDVEGGFNAAKHTFQSFPGTVNSTTYRN